MRHAYQQVGQAVVVHVAHTGHRETQPTFVDAVGVVVAIDLASTAVTFGHQAGVQATLIQNGTAALRAQGSVGEGVERRTHDHIAIPIAVEVTGQADRKAKVGTRVGGFDGVSPDVVGNVV